MTKEAEASQIYHSYAAWASSEGYGGIANFLFRHTNEGRNHMVKFLEYILERGAKVNVEALPPSKEPTVFNFFLSWENLLPHIVSAIHRRCFVCSYGRFCSLAITNNQQMSRSG